MTVKTLAATGVRSSRAQRPHIAFAMGGEQLRDALVNDSDMARLRAVADVCVPFVICDFDAVAAGQLARVEVLITGWSAPRIDAGVLDRMPRLRMVSHAAGGVKGHLDEEVWRRGVVVTNAVRANAIPVAELTVSFIVMAAKELLRAQSLYRAQRSLPNREVEFATAGHYDKVIGIVGASTIGSLVIDRLRDADLRVLLYDPTLTHDQALALGVQLVGLDELMARSDIVSLHAPLIPETRHMVGPAQLSLMHDGATLVNTARGGLVDHDALRHELVSGRLNAFLDVTDPEPLPPGDPLYDLPNVLLTPHIAGAMGTELHRLGHSAVVEVERYAAGLTPLHPVLADHLSRTA